MDKSSLLIAATCILKDDLVLPQENKYFSDITRTIEIGTYSIN
jgi:hypothetical protein